MLFNYKEVFFTKISPSFWFFYVRASGTPLFSWNVLRKLLSASHIQYFASLSGLQDSRKTFSFLDDSLHRIRRAVFGVLWL